MIDTRLLGIINVTGTGHREVPLKMWLQAKKSEFRLYKSQGGAPLMYIYDNCAVFSEESPQEYAPHSSATQVSVSPPNILQQHRQEGSYTGQGGNWADAGFQCFQKHCGRICTYILQAAHEVVAGRRARQVRRVQATPYVEEVIGAQHGVVLLCVAGGGEDAVHQDRHLEQPMRSRAHGKILSGTERTGLIISSFISPFLLSSP